MTPVLIVLVVFSFVIVIVKMGMEHEREKMRMRMGGAPQEGMRMSELREIIRSAVQDANAPLEARIAELEQHLEREQRRLLPPEEESLPGSSHLHER